MHDHDHDHRDGARAPGPAAARPAPAADALLGRAAALGRPDVLGADGLLQLQRAAGNGAVSDLVEEERSPVLDVVGSGRGSALPAEVRAEMETRLGHDFSDVRVHDDAAAHASAQAVDAHAYTVGRDVVFGQGGFDPASDAGRRVLAHELTHVVQQRSGPVDGSPAGGGVRVSDPADRFEREAADTAERAMAAPAVQRVSEDGEELEDEV
ncbi:DUF4157 domain-containing protein [Georgenia faecalis]|uniref:DUF4157 domain-containing protein n=1 Tax=Georgenia faecalis TaxID=2483799 RepID=A0ABV9DCL7_9MICO|nr:DUF4157 domain-containing protein [Georgenia faecalis]